MRGLGQRQRGRIQKIRPAKWLTVPGYRKTTITCDLTGKDGASPPWYDKRRCHYRKRPDHHWTERTGWLSRGELKMCTLAISAPVHVPTSEVRHGNVTAAGLPCPSQLHARCCRCPTGITMIPTYRRFHGLELLRSDYFRPIPS